MAIIYYLQVLHIDGLLQERRTSTALAMELRLSCTNPSICSEPGNSFDWEKNESPFVLNFKSQKY